MALNRAKVASDISLSASLYYVVSIQYFDNAAPTVILWAETFVVPRSTSTAELQAMVVKRGQEIRAAFADQEAARTAVPNGTTITVP